MDYERRAIRMGMTLIAWALAARLVSIAAPPVAAFLARPEIAPFLVYMETGRIVRINPPEVYTEPSAEPSTETTEPAYQQHQVTLPPEEKSWLEFLAEDAALVELRSQYPEAVDIPALLLTELSWDLSARQPAVLILHTHATESFTQTEGNTYTPSSPYRTRDPDHNMLRVGQELKTALEAMGIGVIHDTTLHDDPSYTDAYANSRATARAYLEQYPSICLVLDLHRDALDLSEPRQLTTHATAFGRDSAQLMLVMGSDAAASHPGWQENLALAVKLQARLEQLFPGICRPMSLRTGRFNQDLSPGALLIEVGAAGDTLEQALTAVRALAQGIGDLAGGVRASSTS